MQLPDAPAAVTNADVNLTFTTLSRSTDHHHGEIESWTRLFSNYTVSQHFSDSATSSWTKLSFSYGHFLDQRLPTASDLEHYTRRIPWAGPFILQLSGQANAHPKIVTILKMVQPRF